MVADADNSVFDFYVAVDNFHRIIGSGAVYIFPVLDYEQQLEKKNKFTLEDHYFHSDCSGFCAGDRDIFPFRPDQHFS
jgi:hypothetical protein